MIREEAIAEVERRRAADPGASWIANQRDGDWVVVRIGVAPTKVTGTATKPPPVGPQGDPHSAVERRVVRWRRGLSSAVLFAARRSRATRHGRTIVRQYGLTFHPARGVEEADSPTTAVGDVQAAR